MAVPGGSSLASVSARQAVWANRQHASLGNIWSSGIVRLLGTHAVMPFFFELLQRTHLCGAKSGKGPATKHVTTRLVVVERIQGFHEIAHKGCEKISAGT